MKDISAALIGLVPAAMLWCLGISGKFAPLYFFCGLVSIGLCLLIYLLVQRLQDGAALILLALGFPLMFYVFVAASHPIFLPLFYGMAGLVVLTGCLGTLISGNWSWLTVGRNIGFMCSVLLIVVVIGRWLDVLYIEAGILAVGAFGITRICEMDFVSWVGPQIRKVNARIDKVG